MTVPFLDLKAQYHRIREEIDAAIRDVLDSCAFAGGPFVEKFEGEWAAYCGVRYAVGVGSGTEALRLALLACGIGEGDEVITVPNSFLATAEAISLAGATPVFVDVEPKTYTMDTRLLPAAITERTRAIIPVHIFGQAADLDPILELARAHSLFVIEDACQAHGAEYKGNKVGSIGDVGCFSFYPGKNLGAYGEAGAIVTNSQRISEQVRILRDHGQHRKYHHSSIGCNGRMDGIQGSILSVKLKHLDEWNQARRRVAREYRTLLAHESGVVTPPEAPSGTHVYHIFAIRVQNRDQMLEELDSLGIHCGVHYPIPIHLQAAYASLGLNKGSYPVAERCAEEFLSLPLYPELTDDQIRYASAGIRTSATRNLVHIR